MRLALVLAVAAIVAGCVNGFAKFYQPAPGSDQVFKSPYAAPPAATPSVYGYSGDPAIVNHKLQQDGYVYLGQASFYGNANKVSQSQAVEQGKKVGASVILISSQYMDTVSGAVPYTVQNAPVVSTVNTTGTVSSYGSGGYASGNYNANSIVTTPGGSTTYQIPYSFNRNSYAATFWAKRSNEKIVMGINPLPLTDDLRRHLQRNTGLIVGVVVRGTPAFLANILEGDVLLKIGDDDVTDVMGLATLAQKYAGHTVDFQLIRNDEPKTIPVALRPSLSR